MRRKTICTALLALAVCLQGQTIAINPADLKGDLSFLAADVLQGRYTPSPGLEVAAEFIASRFRAIGLEPGGDNGTFFQNASMTERRAASAGPLTAHNGATTITVDPAHIRVYQAAAALHLENVPVVKLADHDPAHLAADLAGKVALMEGRPGRALLKGISEAHPALVIALSRMPSRAAPSRLIFNDAPPAAVPIVLVESRELSDALTTTDALTLSLDIPAPEDHPVSAKNIVGILPGSDPGLKSTCLLVTAHYDHIGTVETATGLTEGNAAPSQDTIFNGANDDGSGTVSVIAIARALAPLHPKRSIVFIAFFGEERGLLGSTFYGKHPVVPISQTIADINLEQVGRTDSNHGPQVATASLTGYDYSTVTKFLEDAGASTGVKIYKDDEGSDAFFIRSDNAALAELGVPAHTLTTAFEYPDYHTVGDEWQKIDYANMATIDQTVALAVLHLANSATAPEWNADNPRTAAFRNARRAVEHAGEHPAQ